MNTPPKDSLVLFRNRPARVTADGEKLEVTTEDGRAIKVRPKDIVLLHPGPFKAFAELKTKEGDPESAWEVLAGGQTYLEELAELAFDAFTPATAWAAWNLLQEGILFRGEPDAIQVASEEEVNQQRALRAAKQKEQEEWGGFIARLRANRFDESDRDRLASVVAVARGKTAASKVLKELDRSQTPEIAHGFLLRLGFWDDFTNPHPYRFEVPESSADLPVPLLPDEERVDLTHLPAYAIDDEGNLDPDDAISLDGDKIWVHVADVGALVPPDSDMDREARDRGANAYLPERTTTMLPPAVTAQLGLGLQEVSPALSFGIRIDADGKIQGEAEIVLSKVKVTRITYRQAEEQLHTAPFAELFAITQRYQARRKRLGAAMLSLPEVRIKVNGPDIQIRPLERLDSREMVTDAMLMAGEAAALFAIARDLPFPYAQQEPPDTINHPQTMAEMFEYRKQFKRTRNTTVPGLHAGLGLPVYARATSPLRRYLDLVVHQQLRAYLKGQPPLASEAMIERVGSAESVSGQLRSAERAANRHWTLVFLKQHPEWEGEAVLVDKRRGQGVFLIPSLGYDTQLPMEGDPPLDSVFLFSAPKVDIPYLGATFRAQRIST